MKPPTFDPRPGPGEAVLAGLAACLLLAVFFAALFERLFLEPIWPKRGRPPGAA